ncbi:glycosyltransferase [Limnovirga soli]|uniref:Streptomycin biosynthesis protein StrF domain-containing protein n=1 Tax=Limnovirga soli TaxID=2656915 RepID=A0A8J8JVG1_9BACT|nr:glycosyltransferase [Limnovirga soli]NNV56584.1 hypothetical protein [Limnovirga soli]
MISVIVCSRSLPLFQTLSDNIAKTIGVDFEIIRINNANGKMGICAAYNAGAAKAIFPYLCFVHEDVLFHTQYWGRHILAHFKADETIGLIGVAGAVYKSRMCSAWGESESGWIENKRMNIIHHSNAAGNPDTHFNINPANETQSRVAAIDGVFMATTKHHWEQVQFNQSLLTGFHGYDLDYSIHMGLTHKVVVVYDVLIEHFSGGNNTLDWQKAILRVHRKWAHKLPIVFANIQPVHSAYSNGWKRLRKNMHYYLSNTTGFFSVIGYYHQYTLLLEEKPAFFLFLKDYCKGLIQICQRYGKPSITGA